MHVQQERFYQRVLANNVRRVAWVSRRSATAFCGFLDLLSRLGDAQCEVVDLTDMSTDGRPLALWSSEELSVTAPWTRATPLDHDTRAHYLALWHRLVVENADLRVVDAAGPRSVPITFFDQQLISFASPQWQHTARIIGTALLEQHKDDYFQAAGSIFLGARIMALAEAGILNARGNLKRITESEVRLSG